MKKQTTNSSYHQRILRVLVYIQNNLDKDIRLDELARISCFSSFHFHRLFTAMVGESVSAYIRRLKIERAAQQCVYFLNKSITDIAFDAGFSSSSALTKAFQSVMGISPSQLRKKGSIGEYCNPFLHNPIKAKEVLMNCQIQKLAEQQMLFIRKTGDYFKTAPEAWNFIRRYIKDNNINLNNLQLVAYGHDDPAVTEIEACRFDAGIVGLNPCVAEGELGVQTIAAGNYAVFEHKGSLDTLGDTYRKIYGAWLPDSGYELRNFPAYCQYDKEGMINYPQLSENERNQLVTYIYLPIV